MKPEFQTESIIGSANKYYSHKQYSQAKFISAYYFSSINEALSIFIPFKKGKDELVVILPDVYTSPIIKLSEKQDIAYGFIKEKKQALLFADTGAGKTEIYMKFFDEVIQNSQRALFLLPEISLTPQMQKRLEHHFGDAVVMWHSKLTKKAKEKNLEKIHNGTAKVIAGARSALFLPIDDLGIIVVDEEHDDSYKSSSKPRYHARDMAIYMAKKLDIYLILGSATPSLNSYVNFPHFRMKGGHFKTSKEFIYESAPESMSKNIKQTLMMNKRNEKQAIVFIPTRANFKYLMCNTCGFTYECPYCSVGMSMHTKSNALKCHYCNFSQAIAKVCEKCGSEDLESSRLGTAEAVTQLENFNENLKVEQFDRDVITTQKKLTAALKRFNDGEVDVLVGTQMLSKGHDYHNVDLAVVIGIDNVLHLSDYRARERALSLLIQIAGRSGRKSDSKVLVQSFNEDFFARYVSDYELFLKDEITLRQGLYPPFKKLARLVFAHKYPNKASDAMHEVLEKLRHIPNVEVVGFGVAAIEKIAGKSRYNIFLRSDKSTDMLRAIKYAQNKLCEVDIDPIEFS